MIAVHAQFTLTRDPELITTPGGTTLCNLGLASNRRRKQGDNWIDEPIYVDATAFSSTANLIAREYSKGDRIMIHGEWVMKTWEDRNTGKNRNKLEINIASMQFCNSKRDHQTSGGNSQPRRMTDDLPMDIPDDDIPF